MKKIRSISLFLMLIWVLVSCQKEFSIETAGTGGTTNTNCRMTELLESDVQTGAAEFNYISTYDANKKVSRIEIWDSINDVLLRNYPISNTTNKIQVDMEQYFVTGTDGKITEFYGYEDPTDNTSDKIIAKYTYNSQGQLVKRTMEYLTFPGIVFLQTDYIYSGGNLTKAEARINNGTSMQLFGEAVYEYDASKTVKNFLYLHGLAYEIFYFQTAINAGSNSTNPVIKTTLTITDPLTGVVNNYVTQYVNYVIDANKYVTSFEVTGFDFYVAQLYSGKKYTLKYNCL